jgi:hypothetical protein
MLSMCIAKKKGRPYDLPLVTGTFGYGAQYFIVPYLAPKGFLFPFGL